ncbi:peptidoglycan-binding domain-containing protein [Luteimicrobium sp. DT211]|uniref:peptidoglycan-binding domain-containing protein n=1 Tax=Luteimicrobium sp. DT211 TaxID=3393412 RepID=UPI003CECB442
MNRLLRRSLATLVMIAAIVLPTAFSATSAQAATYACTSAATIGGLSVPVYHTGAGETQYCTMSTSQSATWNGGAFALQYALHTCYGYDLEIDGHFGPDTKKFLAKAQAREGITGDGVYGPITSSHLKFVLAASPSKCGGRV